MSIFSKKAHAAFKAVQKKEKKYSILVVDDEENNLHVMEGLLSEDYNIHTATSGHAAMEILENLNQPEDIQMIISDQRMPGMTGLEFLERSMDIAPNALKMIITGYTDLDVVVNSINKIQVFRFFLKPYEEDELVNAITMGLKQYDEERRKSHGFTEIVGQHPKLLSTLDLVQRVADSSTPVLIRGETGTGKELMARAVYFHSPRHDKPFSVLHCGALPETLFEAELFGHKKGAFTGAQTDRAGRISQVDGGTLFIDEVGEIPLAVQAKLLRFFQFGEFQRIGSDKVEKVDVRIVAATHRDLVQMVEDGTFRQDLYYRLNVVEVQIPPLRERRSDIPLLAEAFLAKYKKPGSDHAFSKNFMMILEAYDFPGNIRELAHLVERACLLARGRELGPELLPPEILAGYKQLPANVSEDEPLVFEELTNEVLKKAREDAKTRAVSRVERAFLEQLMSHAGGNVSAAARTAGMQRSYLHKLLSSHDIKTH